MAPLPLNALRAFALAVQHGGVRAAARELDISHSAVSRHIAELERWLGVGLLERADGMRGFVVTAQGRQLAAVASQALADLARATGAVREQRATHAVTISTTPSFASRWLLPRLPALERAHPGLEVSVVVDQRLDDPHASVSEFAIRTGQGPWPDVDAEPLMDDALYPVMSAAAWEAAGRPTRPEALRGLRLLHDRDANTSWQHWRQQFGPQDLDVRAGPRFASSDLVLRAAASGLGVALARHRLAADDVATGALVRPFGDRHVAIKNAYWIVTPQRVTLRTSSKMAIAWLRREAEGQAAA
jgi:LysR family glycine cleavage system transcriptional activator